MRPSPARRFLEPVELYDLCHQWIDHRGHGGRIAAFLDELGVPEGGLVVEAACGSGLWLAQVPPRWRRGGFDLDAASLRRAAGRVPGARFERADLCDWTWPEPVDAALALFGALAYVSDEALPVAVAALRDVLAPGGVALVEPWVDPADFVAAPQMVVVDTPALKVARQVLPAAHQGWVELAFHHHVTARGLRPTTVVTHDRLRLRPTLDLENALVEGGLEQVGAIAGTAAGRQITAWRRR